VKPPLRIGTTPPSITLGASPRLVLVTAPIVFMIVIVARMVIIMAIIVMSVIVIISRADERVAVDNFSNSRSIDRQG
jgi:hypothetical protein